MPNSNFDQQFNPLWLAAMLRRRQEAEARRAAEEREIRAKLRNRTEELERHLANIALFLKSQISIAGDALPITDDVRIDLIKYAGADLQSYSVLAVLDDQRKVAEFLSRRQGINIQNDGERLEMYTTAVLNTALYPEYIVLRSSFFDDFQNQVDHLLINLHTGKVICAFDNLAAFLEEEGAAKYPRAASKQAKIIQKNIAGGAAVKYGLKITRVGEGRYELTKKPLTGLPIFYIAVSPDILHYSLLNSGYTESRMVLRPADLSFLDVISSSLQAQITNLKHQYTAAKALKPRQDFTAQLARIEALNSVAEKLLMRSKK